jgi:hypothetical protein
VSNANTLAQLRAEVTVLRDEVDSLNKLIPLLGEVVFGPRTWTELLMSPTIGGSA